MPGTAARNRQSHGGWTISMVFVVLAAPGCSVYRYAKLVSIDEPKQFCERRDDVASMATYRSWADAAWSEQGIVCPEDCLSGDYSWGFREGFAGYVYAGGSGQPPALPPRPYWQVDMRTPEGARAVQSWFAGYRHGARLARDGGFRDLVTLSVSASLADCDACGCPDESPTAPLLQPATPSPMIDNDGEPPLLRQPTELVLPPRVDPESLNEPDSSPMPEPEDVPTLQLKQPRSVLSPAYTTSATVSDPLVSSIEDGPMSGAITGSAIFQVTR